jgi:hypothetical protein
VPSPPDITVITPTIAGREDLLAECQASVRALGLPHLIGLDVHREGPATIRNRLVEQVTTEWVLFLDDDDLLYGNYLTAVTPHLADAEVVYTAWRLTGYDDPQPMPFNPDALLRANYIPVTACVRTAAFGAVGGFPTDVPLEDHELWKRLLLAGYRFRYVPVIAWWYRRRPDSRTEANADA